MDRAREKELLVTTLEILATVIIVGLIAWWIVRVDNYNDKWCQERGFADHKAIGGSFVCVNTIIGPVVKR